MAKKSIFTARNPLENINTGKAKDLMKKLDNDDIIKQEVMKLDGAKLTKINKGILLKIDFSDREFINKEILFDDLLKDDKLHELSKSIGAIGLINPIYLIEKENGYKILSGFRRSTAVFWGFENIEDYNVVGGNNLVIIPSDAPYELLDTISLHENTLREDLTTLELSLKIWKESRHKNKKIENIAEDYGISKRSVNRYLRVEKYPKELLEVMDKINIRKADTIYNLLNKNKTSDFSKIIDEVLPLEIGEIEKIIKTPSGRSDKISIKPKKKSIIIEINSLLSNEDIEKIKKFINEFL